MKFNYVKFKNFLSYGDTYTVPLSKKGVTLLSGYNNKDGGSNGSGKSTAVVDSVVYGLFGQTTKGLKADQVVNNKLKKDCFVEISFDINKDNYIVRRYRQHSEFKNELVFTKNGNTMGGEKIRETQEIIEATIKISFKSFVRSIVLSQEKMDGFAENEPTERRKIIENLLMYEFISKYQKASKEVLKIVRPEIRDLNLKKTEKRETIDTLGENLMEYVEQWETKEARNANKIEKLKEEIAEWETLNPDQELKARENLTKLKSEKETLSMKQGAATSERTLLVGKAGSNRAEIKKLKEELEEVNSNPDKCPVCDSDIKHGVLKDYIEKREKGIARAQEELDSNNKLIEKAKTKVGKLDEKIENKAKEIKEARGNISQVSLEDLKNIQEKITSANSEIKVLTGQIGGEIEEDDYVINTQAKIQDIKDEVKKIGKKAAKLEHEFALYSWWSNALGNSPTSMKSFCVNHILQSLNKYINYYLTFFGYDVSYELDSELEDIIVKDGEDVSFNQLSGGEKRSVEISLVFALYEIVRLKMPDNINIIVLDEILSSSLDDVRITGALELLSELEGRDLSIFVIDHRNLIKENLDCNVIKITKGKDGFSSLELD